MKYTKYLLQLMIPEWVKLYLNFKLLKTYLKVSSHVRLYVQIIKSTKCRYDYNQIKQLILRNPDIQNKLLQDHRDFIQFFREEMKKVESFIIFKYQDIKGKYIKLQFQTKIMQIHKEELQQLTMRAQRMPVLTLRQHESAYKEKSYVLKQSLYAFYQEIQQFQTYADLNYTAIIKILKKYKKQMPKYIRKEFESQNELALIPEELSLIKQIPNRTKNFTQQVEKQLILHFYPLYPKSCRYHLRKYTEQKTVKSITYYKLGLFTGLAMVLVLFILYLRYDGLVDPDQSNVFSKLFPCFRGVALFLIYYWLLALDLSGWNYFKINYRIYLGFNHHFSTVPEVLKRASYLSTVFLFVFVFYILQSENVRPFRYVEDWNLSVQFMPTRYLPLIVWLVLLIYVFIPTKRSLNASGRRWMYRMIYGMLIGHFFCYESRQTFFLDQIVSMVTPLRDLDYTICYYYYYVSHSYYIQFTTSKEFENQCYYQERVSGMLIAVIPYSLKCIHYLTRAKSKGAFYKTDEMWNFLKTFLVVCVGFLSFFGKKYDIVWYIWIPTAIVSTLWQYWWDLNKDFLFFEAGSRFKFLRNDLGYNKPQIYYILAIVNLFLRMTWALSISTTLYIYLGVKDRELFIFIVGFLEMNRRCLNNFLKMEKEYIVNLRSLKNIVEIKYPFEQVKLLDTSAHTIGECSLSSLRPSDSRQVSAEYFRLSKVKDSFDDQIEEIQNKAYRNYKVPDEFERFVNKTVDMQVIEKAKQSEKFQMSKIKEVQIENSRIIHLIDQIGINH